MVTVKSTVPEGVINVRLGPLADICSAKRHVCFTPESDPQSALKKRQRLVQRRYLSRRPCGDLSVLAVVLCQYRFRAPKYCRCHRTRRCHLKFAFWMSCDVLLCP